MGNREYKCYKECKMIKSYSLQDGHEDLAKECVCCYGCNLPIYGIKSPALRRRHIFCGGSRYYVKLVEVETTKYESPLETLLRLNITNR